MSTRSKTTVVDSAILRALSISDDDATTAKITSHGGGGSGFASIFRMTTPTSSVFVKTSSAPGAAIMFEGEHASLNAINSVVPSLCPRSLAWGKLENEGGRGYFLVTEFLDLGGTIGRGSRNGGGTRGGGGGGGGSGMSLAQKLAKLHSTPAPPLPPPSLSKASGEDSNLDLGEEKKLQFGFPVPTCCGETPQPNDYKSSWAEFFAENRLRAILDRAEKNQGRDSELRRVVEQTCDKVVPRLLGDDHLGGSRGKIVPVLVHGDLWSGNKGRGVFVGRHRRHRRHRQNNDNEDEKAIEEEEEEEVVYDPSVTYAHSEYDHGIMNMFGGFGSSFWNEYFSLILKTEPVDEYDDRVRLYESYHHLNHYAMFGGGGYKGGAMGLLRPLIRKYT